MKTNGEKNGLEIEELKKQLEEKTNDWKRALADYQNLEKRAREERESWVKLAARELIIKLLPGLDSLEKAAKHVADEGVRLALKQFIDALMEEGLTRIETMGRQFDPHLMECIDVAPGKDDNKVVEELQPGYLLHGNIVRAAKVVVGKKTVDDKAEKMVKQE